MLTYKKRVLVLLKESKLGSFVILKHAFMLLSLLLLSACELLTLPGAPISDLSTQKVSLCNNSEQKLDFAEFCASQGWLVYLIEVQPKTWPQRQEEIESLDEKPLSLIKKIILSQGASTPYQHRLRAQNWIVKVNAKASSTMQTLLSELIYENSKQLLEFESAITILSRVNARQEKAIKDLQLIVADKELELTKQRDQVEQLLKIETDLIEQNRSTNR